MNVPTPEYIELLQLTTELRTAQRAFSRTRHSDNRRMAEKAEKRMDEYLKKVNPAFEPKDTLFSS